MRGEAAMLERGDQVPHVELKTVEGEAVAYARVWQRKNLVLVVLPPDDADPDGYASRLAARRPEIASLEAECIVTRDAVAGLPAPAVLVADRWGEIAHVAAGSAVSDLPAADEVLDWLTYLQNRCPECEGEAR